MHYESLKKKYCKKLEAIFIMYNSCLYYIHIINFFKNYFYLIYYSTYILEVYIYYKIILYC